MTNVHSFLVNHEPNMSNKEKTEKRDALKEIYSKHKSDLFDILTDTQKHKFWCLQCDRATILWILFDEFEAGTKEFDILDKTITAYTNLETFDMVYGRIEEEQMPYDFESIMQRNIKRSEKEKIERAKSNKGVIRSHRLKR